MTHKIPFDEREKILEEIKRLLFEKKEILLAIVYGGFVQSPVFRDIDIGVYTGYKVSWRDSWLYADDLNDEIEKLTKIKGDVKFIEYAPVKFKIIMLRGKLLFERECCLRAMLYASYLEDYMDIETVKTLLPK
ncbi:nucleotidyltransferase domain-containing protein [Stygiolobus caldivivus]|uniref:nucleotidyltransferase domain-containing protein n=1 Tax=Stygiolobus caldivivus TaxID=2824673 RepID=UPI001CED38C1|nr:nucleotidyltransferase domain-containing protein [Stygiolobus caldivivus]